MREGVPAPSSEAVRLRMQAMAAGRDTGPEVRLRHALRSHGYRGYRIDWDLGLPGVRRRADIAYVGRRLAVFVDGCYWHVCPDHGTQPHRNAGYWSAKLARNVERDRETDRLAESVGWCVLRVWEHEDPASAAKRIVDYLDSREDPPASE